MTRCWIKTNTAGSLYWGFRLAILSRWELLMLYYRHTINLKRINLWVSHKKSLSQLKELVACFCGHSQCRKGLPIIKKTYTHTRLFNHSEPKNNGDIIIVSFLSLLTLKHRQPQKLHKLDWRQQQKKCKLLKLNIQNLSRLFLDDQLLILKKIISFTLRIMGFQNW